MAEPSPNSPNGVLHSWKEIAAHLKRGVRTVQRWEQSEGLPVHRHEHAERSSVYALVDEIDQWWLSRRKMLEKTLEEPPVSAPETSLPPRQPGHKVWIAAAVVCVLMAAGARWLAVSGNAGGGEPRELPFTSDPNSEIHPAFSPDGQRVAYAWSKDRASFDIYLKQVGGAEPKLFAAGAMNELFPAWSPDGRSIAFERWTAGDLTEIVVKPVAGGDEKTLISLKGIRTMTNVRQVGRYHCWDGDGKSLIVSHRAGQDGPLALYRLTVDGALTQITFPPQTAGGDGGPAVSPDGKTIAFHRYTAQASAEIWILSSAGQARQITHEDGGNAQPVWTPDGKEILFTTYREALFELRRVAVTGGPARRAGGFGRGAAFAAIAPRTRRLAYQTAWGADDDIWRLDLDAPNGPGRSKAVVFQSTRQDVAAEWSPDGKRMALISSRNGTHEVWTCDADAGNCAEWTHFGAPFTGPVRWSPDGKWLVTGSSKDSQGEIYVLPSAGGVVRNLTNHSADDVMPSWSRDGKWIYFGSNRTGAYQIWRMTAEGGSPRQMTQKGGYVPMESWEGGTLYYTYTLGADSGPLRQMPTEGGEERELIHDPVVTLINFFPDKEGIYVSKHGPGPILFYRFATGKLETVWVNAETMLFGLSLSPDRKSLLFSQRKPTNIDLVLVENFR